MIVCQTNIYSQQKNIDLGFTRDELYVVLGTLLLSGYAKYPNKRMFWNSTSDVPTILKNSMRLNRFETLLHHIHFNNNLQIDRSDKLYKIRPIIDALNDRFRKHGGLEEHISIDESMIPYYGKHYAKQYIKGKPIRFGYKNWALCTNDGYMVSFDVYTGKSQNNTEEGSFGLGSDIVLKLLKNQIFYQITDTKFTSIIILQAYPYLVTYRKTISVLQGLFEKIVQDNAHFLTKIGGKLKTEVLINLWENMTHC